MAAPGRVRPVERPPAFAQKSSTWRGWGTLYKGLIFQDLIRLRKSVNASQRGSFGPSSQEQG